MSVAVANPTVRVHLGHHLPDGLASPDIYFTPNYGRAASITEGGEWVLLEAFDGSWQVPLVVRTLIDGTKDAISPHFSGVYASPSLSPVQIQQAWSATVRSLGELGVISVLLRDSPLVPHPPHTSGQQPIVSMHPTIVLDTTDADAAWHSMAGTCRTRIRKALKNGYTGEVRPASEQDLAQGSDFRRLYEQTMLRLDASPVYYFGDGYYRELLAGLGANLLLAEVRRSDGVAVASALFMRHQHRLHYHLVGSNMDDARMGTNNLMIWVAAQFASGQSLGQLHLGGGNQQRDSLFRFKRTFGGHELEYGISGLVIDPERYSDNVKRRAKENDTSAEALLAANYFPAYRVGTR